MSKKSGVKAVAMLSGGLDSSLALALILEQGIDVIGVNFSTGFCLTDHAQQVQKKDQDPEKLRNEALKTGMEFKIPVEIIDIAEGYMDVLKNPKHGYGKNVNPCVDCRIMMMRRAKIFMEEQGADFIFTGEVLGQRPKSQHRHALSLIAHEAGLYGRLLRPLSAKLLPETIPEAEGLVNREALKAFHGRSRKPQIELAESLKIMEWQQPAGGCCYLTDPNYSVKVFDLFEHGRKDDLEREDLILCKVGRHFRVSAESKVIVGRFEEENTFLENYSFTRPRLVVEGFTGPTTIIDGKAGAVPSEEDMKLAARLTARYSAGRREEKLQVLYRHNKEERILEVEPFGPEECERWMIQ